MKTQNYLIAIAILLVATGGFFNAAAQTQGSNSPITAVIPFRFNLGDQSLPAGEYTIRCVNPAADLKVLQLRSQNGDLSMLVQTSSVIGNTKDAARLVFNRYGDRYYFAQVWLAGDKIGMQTRKSRSEKATANELASIARATEVVALRDKR